MTKHFFRDVLEHDIDMLILEEFSCSEKFVKIFTNKIGIEEANVLSTYQSKTDNELGESDITIILEDNNLKKFALLIEDKIDAVAMPEQPSRYTLRGNKGIADGDFEKFYVFIVAPENYLKNNEKAKEYPNNVSYEEIREYFNKTEDSRKSFKIAQLDSAIEKQKNGYQAIKNYFVTEFWNSYVEYRKCFYPDLNLIVSSDIKPTNGFWTYFRTNSDNAYICYKSNKGNVDLTYNGKASETEEIKALLSKIYGNYYENGLSVVQTGKSCAIRIKVPIVDFSESFEGQKNNVKQSFEAVKKLNNLCNRLDIAKISPIIK